MSKYTFLLFGGTGWIGTMIHELLVNNGHKVSSSTVRLENRMAIMDIIKNTNPDFVIHTAGITGKPTVDWCEDNKQETYRVNAVGTFNLADVCNELGIHMTYYSSGCIYHYDDDHPIGSKFIETDIPNFIGSTYSKSKILSEQLLEPFNNVLILRIRLPINTTFHPKNLISKLIKYEKVTEIPNSMTVLPNMLPISLKLILSKKIGIFNFTNPGTITHTKILSLYKEYINNDHTWEIFTEAEQDKILKSKRSNCELDTSKLENLYELTPIHEAIKENMIKMANTLHNCKGSYPISHNKK